MFCFEQRMYSRSVGREFWNKITSSFFSRYFLSTAGTHQFCPSFSFLTVWVCLFYWLAAFQMGLWSASETDPVFTEVFLSLYSVVCLNLTQLHRTTWTLLWLFFSVLTSPLGFSSIMENFGVSSAATSQRRYQVIHCEWVHKQVPAQTEEALHFFIWLKIIPLHGIHIIY